MPSLMFSHGCKKGQEQGKEITPVEIDLFAPALNEPGPLIVPKSGDFTVAVIPNTQDYTASKKEETPKILESQIEWIKNYQKKEAKRLFERIYDALPTYWRQRRRLPKQHVSGKYNPHFFVGLPNPRKRWQRINAPVPFSIEKNCLK